MRADLSPLRAAAASGSDCEAKSAAAWGGFYFDRRHRPAPGLTPPSRRDQPIVADAENLLSLLAVRVDRFAVLSIEYQDSAPFAASDELDVHYVLGGGGTLDWNGGSIELHEGMVVIVPRTITCCARGPDCRQSGSIAPPLSTADPCNVRRLTAPKPATELRIASASVAAGIGRGLGLFDHLVEPHSHGGSRLITTLFGGLTEELAAPGIGGQSIVEAYMKQILLTVFREAICRNDVRSPLYLTIADYQMAKVVSAILGDLAQRHSMSSLARMAGTTPCDLVQRFADIFDETPAEFIHEFRMTTAKRLLVATRLPVKSIAANVGFASRSHFSRAFSKAYGQDPTAFRQDCER